MSYPPPDDPNSAQAPAAPAYDGAPAQPSGDLPTSRLSFPPPPPPPPPPGHQTVFSAPPPTPPIMPGYGAQQPYAAQPSYGVQQQPYGAQQYGAQPQAYSAAYGPPAPAVPPQPMAPAKPSPLGEFLRAVVSLDFKTFVTPKVLTVLHVFVMVLAVLSYFGGLISAISAAVWSESPISVVSVLLYIVTGAVGVVVIVAVARVMLEFFAATIQTAENSAKVAETSSSILDQVTPAADGDKDKKDNEDDSSTA